MGFLATNVAFLRNRIGITSEQLATRLGVGKTTVENIETGYITSPTQKILEALAKVFDTTVEGLLGIKPLEISGRVRLLYIVDSIDVNYPFVELDKVVGHAFVDCDLVRGYESFALKITDNAMVNRRIISGDIVVVKKDCPIKNNDIVVVATEKSTFLRSYCKNSDNTVTLKAENDSGFYEDITLKESVDNIKIIGKVIKCEFAP